ncbi:MAG: SPOR domain-containing protein [Hydrogenophaga sp.]|jgi:septal ring-binding cell division protein DamX|nr:SPOR domain-containing protein [Hydrogenophaga sp.]
METDWNPSAAPGHDKLPPLEGLFHALAHEGRSVLMVSDDEALLDTCGQSVVRKLRQNPDMEVSVMFDMDREVLLQHFARHVENLSVDEALQSTSAPPTQQVWLQHLHNSTELEQAKLLIRLCTDFPASGVKLLLMANNLCADDLIHHGQTKKLLVWHAPVMRKLVVPVEPSAAKPLAAAASTPPHWLDDAAAAVPADFAFGKEAPPVTRTKPGQRWVVQLLLGVFVLVSVVVLGLNQWQSKQNVQEEVAAPAVDAPQEPAVVAVTEAVPIVLPNVPEPAPSVPPEPVVVAPVAPAPPGLAWARELKVGGWVVQHVALDTLNDIQTWQAQHPALSRAQTVPLLRPNGQRYWVLVSGPFTTLERANAFAQSPGVPKNHWSRAVASLQGSLDKQP